MSAREGWSIEPVESFGQVPADSFLSGWAAEVLAGIKARRAHLDVLASTLYHRALESKDVRHSLIVVEAELLSLLRTAQLAGDSAGLITEASKLALDAKIWSRAVTESLCELLGVIEATIEASGRDPRLPVH